MPETRASLYPSDDSTPFDIVGLIGALGGVDFIVVGGVAATLHGGPRLTVDLESYQLRRNRMCGDWVGLLKISVPSFASRAIDAKTGAGRPQDLADVRYLERIRSRAT